MSNFNLTLEPAQSELIAKPNSGFTQAYSITNNSQSQIVLTTEVLPWAPLGNTGLITYNHNQVESNPHLQFSLTNADLYLGQSFTLKPGEKKQLVLKVKSDSTIPLTDSYFTFFVNQDLTNSLASDISATSATARLGSHLLLSTSITENPASQFSIDQFSINPRFKDILFSQVQFTSTIYNSGNYFNKSAGKITVTKNGLIVKELNIFPRNILAHSSRQIDCLSDNQPIPCTLDPPFWPGAYTATMTLDPAFGSKSISTTFFVFPYTFIVSIVVLATLIFFLTKIRSK